MTVKNN